MKLWKIALPVVCAAGLLLSGCGTSGNGKPPAAKDATSKKCLMWGVNFKTENEKTVDLKFDNKDTLKVECEKALDFLGAPNEKSKCEQKATCTKYE